MTRYLEYTRKRILVLALLVLFPVAASAVTNIPAKDVITNTTILPANDTNVQKTLDDLQQRSGNANLSKNSTDQLPEGSTNQYYTDTRARASISAGAGIAINNTSGQISSTITQYNDTQARAALSSSATGLAYNQTTGVFTLTNGYAIPGTGDQSNWSTAYQNYLNKTRGAWKVFYSDGSGVFQEIALGTAGQVLQSNGATSAPTFNNTSAGFTNGSDLNASNATVTQTLTVQGAANLNGGMYVQGNGSNIFNSSYYSTEIYSTPAVDWGKSNVQRVNLTDNGTTTFTFANLSAGMRFTLELFYPNGGNCTLVFPADVRWTPNNTTPTWTNSSNQTDVLACYRSLKNFTVCGAALNVSLY